jgi:uncharacterized protein
MPWYKKGLRFTCTGCGQCCTGEPGFVWLSDEEIHEIATYLKISNKEFLRLYTRSIFGKTSLIETRKENDCIFLKEKKCQIYNVRPKQCRTFPWWKENLQSLENWKETAERCEGINHPDAPLISFDEIEKQQNK